MMIVIHGQQAANSHKTVKLIENSRTVYIVNSNQYSTQKWVCKLLPFMSHVSFYITYSNFTIAIPD